MTKTKIEEFVKRYRFFLLLLFINVLLMFLQPSLGQEVAELSIDNLKEMLSILPPIFLLLGLMDVWVPKETIMKYMGKGAGIKGVSLTNIFIFVGA